MGITTLNNTYLLTEIKEGFSEVTLGNAKIRQREFEGTDYVSFSNRCTVHHTPINSEIEEGSEVIVEHSVIDRVITIEGVDYLVAEPNEIYAVKVNNDYDLLSEDYVRCFKPFNGFLALPAHKKVGNGFKDATTHETSSEEMYAVDLDGVEIEFLEFADYEIFVNDKRYHFIPEKDCFLVDGVLNESRYSIVTDNMLLLNPEHVYVSRSGVSVTRNDNVRGLCNVG